MSSEFGNRVKLMLFGESHGPAVGVVMEGLPPGEAVDLLTLRRFLARRAGGRALTTSRSETDEPHFLSGLYEGRTTGTPLCAVLYNQDARSSDYAAFSDLPRPSHADYPAQVKYKGYADMRGGGHFSGRMSAPLCVAGGIAAQILARKGITVGAHLDAVGGVNDTRFDPVALNAEMLLAPGGKAFPVLSEAAGERMQAQIRAAADAQDSIGGIVECAAIGIPPGLGAPLFEGVENRISAAMFALGGVRGIEFGAGFAAAEMRGSAHNDAYAYENGRIQTVTNHHGGVLGGLTTGMPLIFRVAFKPTASIAQPQQTVNLRTNNEEILTISGRHDPCIALRAVPCAEAVTALVLLDIFLDNREENRYGD
jgi:chorismate synthase